MQQPFFPPSILIHFVNINRLIVNNFQIYHLPQSGITTACYFRQMSKNHSPEKHDIPICSRNYRSVNEFNKNITTLYRTVYLMFTRHENQEYVRISTTVYISWVDAWLRLNTYISLCICCNVSAFQNSPS